MLGILKGSNWGTSACCLHLNGDEGLSLKQMLCSFQSAKEWQGQCWETQPPPLGMPKEHIKEKNCAITFMFQFLSQMLL